MRLDEPLPTALHGEPVRTDYRVMVAYERLLFDKDASPEQKVLGAIRLFYGREPRNARQDWDGLQWFYRCGAELPAAGGGEAVRAYDFDRDAGLIAAAFQQAYGMDVLAEPLHWWRFKALLEALPESCRFCKIVEYRTADTAGLPESQRHFYEQMKARYALEPSPRYASIEEKNAAFIARLKRGEPNGS